MSSKKTIQNINAGLMLLLFALSVTPKQWLHDVITGHKHVQVKYDAVNVQTSKNNFQCNWQNDDVESPFINQPALELLQPLPVFNSYPNSDNFHYYSAELFYSAFRGPPAMV